MMKFHGKFFIFLLGCSQAISAQDLRLSLGADFISGDYGNATTTDISVLTLGGKIKADKWTWSASIPYLKIKGNRVTVDGVPIGAPTSSTEKGWGDLTLSGAYLGYYDKVSGLGISGKIKIKLPVADEDKGLGTGETDYSMQLDPFKVVGDTTWFGSVGYKVYGDTDTTDYNNVFYASVGAIEKLNPALNLGLGLTGRQKVTDTGAPKKEAFLFGSYKISTIDTVNFHVIKGFSDASPDWGAGLNYSHSFQQ